MSEKQGNVRKTKQLLTFEVILFINQRYHIESQFCQAEYLKGKRAKYLVANNTGYPPFRGAGLIAFLNKTFSTTMTLTQVLKCMLPFTGPAGPAAAVAA